MSAPTNKLVAATRKYAVPTAIATSTALGACLIFTSNGVHAASLYSAAPLDDSSVSALTSLDHAMETVAARVTPLRRQHRRHLPRQPRRRRAAGRSPTAVKARCRTCRLNFVSSSAASSVAARCSPSSRRSSTASAPASSSPPTATSSPITTSSTAPPRSPSPSMTAASSPARSSAPTSSPISPSSKSTPRTSPPSPGATPRNSSPARPFSAFGSPFGYLKFSVTPRHRLRHQPRQPQPRRRPHPRRHPRHQTDAAIHQPRQLRRPPRQRSR